MATRSERCVRTASANRRLERARVRLVLNVSGSGFLCPGHGAKFYSRQILTHHSRFSYLGAVRLRFAILAVACASSALAQTPDERLRNDWAYLQRYQQDNAKLAQEPAADRVVFMGNSITDGWARFF